MKTKPKTYQQLTKELHQLMNEPGMMIVFSCCTRRIYHMLEKLSRCEDSDVPGICDPEYFRDCAGRLSELFDEPMSMKQPDEDAH